MKLILIEILVALGLCAAGAGATWVHMHHKVALAEEARDEAVQALKRSEATLALRETARARTARSAASARASLQHATAAAPTWASEPVPPEVRDALCRTVRCAGSVGVRPDEAASAP